MVFIKTTTLTLLAAGTGSPWGGGRPYPWPASGRRRSATLTTPSTGTIHPCNPFFRYQTSWHPLLQVPDIHSTSNSFLKYCCSQTFVADVQKDELKVRCHHCCCTCKERKKEEKILKPIYYTYRCERYPKGNIGMLLNYNYYLEKLVFSYFFIYFTILLNPVAHF